MIPNFSFSILLCHLGLPLPTSFLFLHLSLSPFLLLLSLPPSLDIPLSLFLSLSLIFFLSFSLLLFLSSFSPSISPISLPVAPLLHFFYFFLLCRLCQHVFPQRLHKLSCTVQRWRLLFWIKPSCVQLWDRLPPECNKKCLPK